MSIYQNHTKGLSCWVSKKLLLSWFVKLLAYGGTDLVQMTVSEMCNSAILIKSSVAIGCNYLSLKLPLITLDQDHDDYFAKVLSHIQ